MTTNIGVVIVERGGTLKNLCIKSFKENELYKKCGFRFVGLNRHQEKEIFLMEKSRDPGGYGDKYN